MTYRRAPSTAMERPLSEIGPVLAWDEKHGAAVIFRCPCGEREVYVKSPPHTITFDEDGRLTLDGSVASTGHSERSRDIGRCHFHMKSGEAEMCGDASCPGGTTP